MLSFNYDERAMYGVCAYLDGNNYGKNTLLFSAYRSPPEVLQTEIIPYISLVNTTFHDTGISCSF